MQRFDVCIDDSRSSFSPSFTRSVIPRRNMTRLVPVSAGDIRSSVARPRKCTMDGSNTIVHIDAKTLQLGISKRRNGSVVLVIDLFKYWHCMHLVWIPRCV